MFALHLEMFCRSLGAAGAVLPYSDKRKQLLKMTFLINEQNVSAMYIDIHAIPYVPKKITTGLSAWITFKVVSESKYNFM